jgi:hypothetical protein
VSKGCFTNSKNLYIDSRFDEELFLFFLESSGRLSISVSDDALYLKKFDCARELFLKELRWPLGVLCARKRFGDRIARIKKLSSTRAHRIRT